jgi:hypothetical protein
VKDQIDVPWKSAQKPSSLFDDPPAPSFNDKPTARSVEVDHPLDHSCTREVDDTRVANNSSSLLAFPSLHNLPYKTSCLTSSNDAAINETSGSGSGYPEPSSRTNQRVICLRHFAHALAEVKPSSSETGMSVRALRKWNAKLGAGECSNETSACSQSRDSNPGAAVLPKNGFPDFLHGEQNTLQSDSWGFDAWKNGYGKKATHSWLKRQG